MCDLLETYRRHGVFEQDINGTLDVMREWYDGYCFARSAGTDMYNTDMVLYYLNQAIPSGSMPDELIDANVRIDYGKLRHLLVGNRGLNGNFDVLRDVIAERQVESEIRSSFPLERLDQRDNFLSLLYYFGLLGIRRTARGVPRLGIPNPTVSHLLYGDLRDAYQDVGAFSVSQHTFSGLVRAMACDGVWRPVLEFLRNAIAEQTGIRDYIDGEKVVHAFLAAHFSMVDHFLIHSEHELTKGYADLYLEPFLARYPDVAYGYVIEIKYLKRSEPAGDSLVAKRLREAEEQLRRYLADTGLRRHTAVRHVGLAVVFHGWELAASWAVE